MIQIIFRIEKATKLYPSKFKGNNGLGDVYEQKIMLYNEDGILVNVVVGWIIPKDNLKQIRFTSSYIKEVKKNE